MHSLTTNCFFFFKQKTAYEMRISDWSSDVCSSDLCRDRLGLRGDGRGRQAGAWQRDEHDVRRRPRGQGRPHARVAPRGRRRTSRSEEHTSELQSLMRISYAVFCLKKKKKPNVHKTN